MIDFSTLKGLTIPEGVVAKIESGGVILWELQTSRPILLEVEKITSNTYAAETTYSGESFILLDVYPRSGGTVTVTYGGLTKTITDDGTSGEPNAQPVFFGTFNGVSDGVETPAIGELIIDGECRAVGIGTYASSSKLPTNYCSCVTSVVSLGSVKELPARTFSGCSKLETVEVPDGVTRIGNGSFYSCTNLKRLEIPESVQSIGGYGAVAVGNDTTFMLCKSLTAIVVDAYNPYFSASDGVLYNKDKSHLITYPSATGAYTVPDTVTKICQCAFYENAKLTSVTFLTTTPPTLEQNVFYGCTALTTITVPAGCGEAYKAANGWSDYADKIVEASA